MNYIFLTQGNTLSVFYEMAHNFSDMVPVEKVGFYISSSQFYQRFKSQCPESKLRYKLSDQGVLKCLDIDEQESLPDEMATGNKFYNDFK